jgi:hypothetical protein
MHLVKSRYYSKSIKHHSIKAVLEDVQGVHDIIVSRAVKHCIVFK